MPGVGQGQGGLGKGVIVGQHFSMFINVEQHCSSTLLRYVTSYQGFSLISIALVLQVGLLGRMEGRRGCRCPHFCLRHLDCLVWGLEGLEKGLALGFCSLMAVGGGDFPLEGSTVVPILLWPSNEPFLVDWFGGRIGNRWFAPMACSACAQECGRTSRKGSGEASFFYPYGGGSHW